MSPRFQSRDIQVDQATRILQALQLGDTCNECLQSLTEVESRTTFLKYVEVAGGQLSNGRLLVHPGKTSCTACKSTKRTVYTLASRLAPRDADKAVGSGVSSLRQDLRSFLTIMESTPSEDDGAREVTIFSPLFVGTDWELWSRIHGAVHDRIVVRGFYDDRPFVAVPLHLWWAQGSWYLMAYKLEPTSDGRGWKKAERGMRSGWKLACVRDLEIDRTVAVPSGLPDARKWLGTGDWLFRGDARENGKAVVLLGSRLLHYFRERLQSGLEADLQLWEFHRSMPSWVKAALPPSLCAHLASDPVSAMSAYVGVENPENDPQTKLFLEADKPAAIVQFPFPLGATGPDGRRVGEFEAARRIMSWGGEAVVLAPIPLALRVQELARILYDRQSRFPSI